MIREEGNKREEKDGVFGASSGSTFLLRETRKVVLTQSRTAFEPGTAGCKVLIQIKSVRIGT